MLLAKVVGPGGRRIGLVVVGVAVSSVGVLVPRVVSADSMGEPALMVVQSMVEHENEAEKHRDNYLYESWERSDRTGGHLWTEWVAETTEGKVHRLIEEDGQPLNAARQTEESARLADVVAHPDAFAKRSQALKNDEAHAKDLMQLLPKAFVFENARTEGRFLKIDFRPNPGYSPKSMEETILHGMTGSLLVEEPVERLHGIEARLPQDVSIGFGLLATIHAGSNFSTTRERVYGNEWKTHSLDTDINGRAIFFKAIAKKEHAVHKSFTVLPPDMSVGQAVELLEKQ